MLLAPGGHFAWGCLSGTQQETQGLPSSGTVSLVGQSDLSVKKWPVRPEPTAGACTRRARADLAEAGDGHTLFQILATAPLHFLFMHLAFLQPLSFIHLPPSIRHWLALRRPPGGGGGLAPCPPSRGAAQETKEPSGEAGGRGPTSPQHGPCARGWRQHPGTLGLRPWARGHWRFPSFFFNALFVRQ